MHIHAHLVQLSKQTHKPILHIVPLIRSSCNMLCLLCSTPRRFFGQQFSPRICGLNLWALGHFMSRFLCWGANRQIIRSISGHCLPLNCCRACRWFTLGVSLVAILFTFPFAFGDSFAFGFPPFPFLSDLDLGLALDPCPSTFPLTQDLQSQEDQRSTYQDPPTPFAVLAAFHELLVGPATKKLSTPQERNILVV